MYDLFPRKTLASVRVGGYRLRVSRDRRAALNPSERLTVSGPGQPLSLGAHRVEVVAPVTDLNGDGLPDAIVHLYSGGAHCCSSYTILSLEPGGPRAIFDYDAGNDGIRPQDLDGDGVAELLTGDDVWAYWNTAYVSSARPRVILSWDGRTWSFSSLLNRVAAPAAAELDALAARLRPMTDQKMWGGPELWIQMLDLIYHGQGDLAYDFLVRVWPAGRLWGDQSRDRFWSDLRAQLARSKFADAIYALNAGQRVDLRPPAPAEGASPP
jgi:hypothetical protein